MFAQHDIAADRVELLGPAPSLEAPRHLPAQVITLEGERHGTRVV